MKSINQSFSVAAIVPTMVLLGQIGFAADVTGDRLNIGAGHTLNGVGTSIAAGTNNTIVSGVDYSTIGGGGFNMVSNNYAFVGGGRTNRVGGAFGTIAGGHSNTNLNTAGFIGGGGFNIALDYATTGGGLQNKAGSYCFVGGGFANDAFPGFVDVIGGGSGNQAWGFYSFTGAGRANQNFGFSGVIGGGDSNATIQTYTTIPGGAQAAADKFGQQAYASGAFKDIGDAQTSLFVVRQTTTTATTNELFLDGAGERMLIAPSSMWAFEVLISAGSTNGNAAGYQFSGVIKNVSGATAIVGTVNKTVLAEDVSSWDAFVEADNTNDALVVKSARRFNKGSVGCKSPHVGSDPVSWGLIHIAGQPQQNGAGLRGCKTLCAGRVSDSGSAAASEFPRIQSAC